MSDLLAIGRSVAGAAGAGEQVEAYVVRRQETDVEVFGGEVESLTTAGIEGVGVRVIVDNRQGYASAGSLDPDVVDETLAEARDNAAFGEPDEWNALATLADVETVERVTLDLWRDDATSLPTDEKVRIALDLEAATKARDTRGEGCRSRGLRRRVGRVGDRQLARSRGNEPAHDRVRVRRRARRRRLRHPDRLRLRGGPCRWRPRPRVDPRDAVDRACRLLGAKPIAGRRIPIVLDPLVTRSVLGVLSSAFNGESVLKGRSLFGGRDGEKIAAPIVEIVDDPTDARAFGAAQYDSEGLPTRRNELIADGVLAGFLHNVYTGRRSGSRAPAAQCAAATAPRPASACARSRCGRARAAPKRSWRRCRRRSTCSR